MSQDFVIQFGKKYKGKRLSDIPRADLDNYVAWLDENSRDPNDPALAELKAAIKNLGVVSPSKAAVVVESSPIPEPTAIQAPGDFGNDKVALIKKTFGQGLTGQEFELYLSVAKARQLDPLLNQIHAVKRSGKMVIQVGIDGFRLIASRTGEYAGRDEAEFEYDANKSPVKAKVTVYRLVNGQRCPFTATARWSEYCPQGNQDFMWKKMPETMLEKVCEAKALRMAFPGEMSGLYSHEEMAQAGEKGQTTNKPPGYTEHDGPLVAVNIERTDKEARAHIKSFGFEFNWEMSRWVCPYTDDLDLAALGMEYEIIESPAFKG